ncbi:MAG: glycosyltransferase [Vulcanimicrobiaceae bacterium]
MRPRTRERECGYARACSSRPTLCTDHRHRWIGGRELKVALVHDYLNQRGGAERVFAQIARAFPDAPIYTSMVDLDVVGDLFGGRTIHTSFLQHMPARKRLFRWYAPLYPRAFEAFDLREYDVVVSSSSAWAKGVLTRPDAVHVSYVHAVSRFVFDYDAYVGGFGVGRLARPVIDRLIAWDLQAAKRPTRLLANSQNVADDIATYYGRSATVLHPPVDLERFTPAQTIGDYFFIASRLLPYKRIDRAIAAAKQADVRLLIAGSGPSLASLRAQAQGSKVELLGFVDDAKIVEVMRAAQAVILPGSEDFGLVPIEAAACGRPTIAFAKGGAMQTVIPDVTGVHFAAHDELVEILRTFDASRFSSQRIRSHAGNFGNDAFRQQIRAYVEDTVARQ